MKYNKIISNTNNSFMLRNILRTVLIAFLVTSLTACATWTYGVDEVASPKDLQTVEITQEIESHDIKLQTPEGWVSRVVTRAQRERSMAGSFEHPEKGAKLRIYSATNAATIAAARETVDLKAEEKLPGSKVSDGPFALGRTALSPMYVRFSGIKYRDGEIVNRQLYGGYNLNRSGFLNYIMIMEIEEKHAQWGKRQFVSILKVF